MEKMSSAILLSIILLIMELGMCCLARNSTFGCIEGEMKALLRFKASLEDPSNRLSPWNWKDKDCCAWQGITCNKITGHVIKLDLSNKLGDDWMQYVLDDWSTVVDWETVADNMLQGKTIDSSLLELKYLRYLDLSWNDFKGSKIPEFLGSMKPLQHLNLSHANFAGVVPYHLGNLSSLRTLDLSGGYNQRGLVVDSLMWASNLSSLVYLDMSYVNLSATKDIVKVLQMLPSLVELHLIGSGLDNTHLRHASVNSTLLTNVQYLDLSGNSLVGEFPSFLSNMTSLRFLDLSANMLNFSLIHMLRSKNLVHLNLASNMFDYEADWNSEFPCFLSNMTSLRFLDLSQNMLNFSLTHLLPLKNLAYLNLGSNSLRHKADSISEFLWGNCHLKSLDLSWNYFYGDISGLFQNLSGCWSHNLESLNLGDNKLDGHLPTSLGKLSALRELYLYGNQLSGEIPISLGQLSNLERLDISGNSFKGTLSEAHFSNLSKLVSLDAAFTMLKFGVGYDWVPHFQLKYLGMGSSKIGGQFPQWLQTQKALTYLNLSNCSITGTLPKWFHLMNLTRLYLSHNNITGPIPELPSSMRYLDLSDNMITQLPSNIGHMNPRIRSLILARNCINGSIPDSLSEMKDLEDLDLANNHLSGNLPDSLSEMTDLEYLDLANNHLSGNLPDSLCKLKFLYSLDLSKNHLSGNLPNCWQNLSNLGVARLSSNELSGVIPNSIGGAYFLMWLHLNNNRLIGQLPSTLKNCTYLIILDVGGNSLSGKLPEWIGKDLTYLEVLRLRDNTFHGMFPSAFCQLSELRVLDLANNMLTGNIPHCFGNLSGMKGLIGLNYAEWDKESLNQVMKGVELEYTRNSRYVLNLDLSSNNLVGEIPSELTRLCGLVGLNLSHNHLGGEIPAKIGDLKSVESLDLSNNILFGAIPHSLSNLSSLSHLNLSNNNLSGQIPTGPQLQTLNDASIYDGNPELCGAPLIKKCPNDEAPIAPNAENHEAEDGNRADKICFYAVIIAGFAVGFWGVIGVLVVKSKWRQSYFKFIDVVMGKMLGY